MKDIELKIPGAKGIPEGSLISIRLGAVRRQAVFRADRPYRFQGEFKTSELMKVDVYLPIAQAQLVVNTDECQGRWNQMLESAFESNQQVSIDVDMNVIDVTKAADKPEPAQPSRESSAKRHQVAIEAQPYFEQHEVMEVLRELLQVLIKEKPEDPYGFMIKVLEGSRNVRAANGRRQRPGTAPPGGRAPTPQAGSGHGRPEPLQKATVVSSLSSSSGDESDSSSHSNDREEQKHMGKAKDKHKKKSKDGKKEKKRSKMDGKKDDKKDTKSERGIPASSIHCHCGNTFVDDAVFCRKCGRPRFCSCGNAFIDDAVFCRKCGVPRPQGPRSGEPPAEPTVPPPLLRPDPPPETPPMLPAASKPAGGPKSSREEELAAIRSKLCGNLAAEVKEGRLEKILTTVGFGVTPREPLQVSEKAPPPPHRVHSGIMLRADQAPGNDKVTARTSVPPKTMENGELKDILAIRDRLRVKLVEKHENGDLEPILNKLIDGEDDTILKEVNVARGKLQSSLKEKFHNGDLDAIFDAIFEITGGVSSSASRRHPPPLSEQPPPESSRLQQATSASPPRNGPSPGRGASEELDDYRQRLRLALTNAIEQRTLPKLLQQAYTISEGHPPPASAMDASAKVLAKAAPAGIMPPRPIAFARNAGQLSGAAHPVASSGPLVQARYVGPAFGPAGSFATGTLPVEAVVAAKPVVMSASGLVGTGAGLSTSPSEDLRRQMRAALVDAAGTVPEKFRQASWSSEVGRLKDETRDLKDRADYLENTVSELVEANRKLQQAIGNP